MPDNSNPRGGDLFIVDNSISGWTGLRYLKDWCTLAERFDIATGFFEIGSLLELDGSWQELKKIRILMGDEVTRRTRMVLLDRANRVLDDSLEDDKENNPFLSGVDAIVAALASGQIECRVYDKDKFHAKTYITHAKLDVIGAQALVGSSNFTRPGLTQNVELNIQVQSGREVAQLQEWFEEHWNEAKDVSAEVLQVITRHTQLFNPFDVYAKALQELFLGHERTVSEWEDAESLMFPWLDRYQKEAYWALMKIARQHGGAFLCDGVGLGKTFVGLMLIERLVLHEGKRVVLFAPKGAKEGVWEPHLRDWLSHIGGIGGGADFSSLAVFSHTDLDRHGDFPDRFKRISELADAVIIDEAHHFRNRGKPGDLETQEGRSRYYKLYDVLDDTVRPKSLFLLTATPINNRLTDFRHMAELFTRQDEAYFARTLGVNNFRGHFNRMERDLQRTLGNEGYGLSERLNEVHDVWGGDSQVFQKLVVQRSRAYAKESQIREKGASTSFPEREDPQVAGYSIRKTYGRLLEMFDAAFKKGEPLFTLPIYYPLNWYKGDDETIDPFEENRQKQVVGLIRTLFLKRFESSVAAFELSCDRLIKKLLAFVEGNSESEEEKSRLELWRTQNAEVLGYTRTRQLDLWGGDEDDVDEDGMPPEFLDAFEHLDRDDYDVPEMIRDALEDLDELVKFLEESRKFDPKQDDKLKKLLQLLKSKDMAGQKVLIFSEFSDTARYLYQNLKDAGIEGVEEVDSGSKGSRADVIRRFSPYYNGSSSVELAADGKKEIRVLISTDILSEGLNLQDACRMINYDIHWNPVRLMQRIGRVDRRMNPDIEQRLLADHPELKTSRGKVRFWNFLPPDELNQILTLYTRVTNKTLLISATLGIEGKKLLRPEDEFQALKDFNHSYEGKRTAIEDMHLEYQDLLGADEDLESRLRGFPGAIFSGRKKPSKGARGVFFCYALPALDKEKKEFTEDAGTTAWYLYDLDSETILKDPGEIIEIIRSKPDTPRLCTTEEATLLDIRKKVSRHIHNTYLRRVDAPIGVKPTLKCWMELNES